MFLLLHSSLLGSIFSLFLINLHTFLNLSFFFPNCCLSTTLSPFLNLLHLILYFFYSHLVYLILFIYFSSHFTKLILFFELFFILILTNYCSYYLIKLIIIILFINLIILNLHSFNFIKGFLAY